jgi:hypothetical protein
MVDDRAVFPQISRSSMIHTRFEWSIDRYKESSDTISNRTRGRVFLIGGIRDRR